MELTRRCVLGIDADGGLARHSEALAAKGYALHRAPDIYRAAELLGVLDPSLVAMSGLPQSAAQEFMKQAYHLQEFEPRVLFVYDRLSVLDEHALMSNGIEEICWAGTKDLAGAIIGMDMDAGGLCVQPGHVHLTGVGGVGKTEEAILLERLQRFQWSGGPRFRVMRTITDRAERQELVNDLRREEMSHLYDTICTGKRIDAAAFKPWQSSGDVNCWKTLDTTYLWPITSKGRDALLDELFAQGIRLRERDVEAIFPIYDAILEGDVVFTLSASAASAQYAHDVARRKGVPTRTYMLSDHDKEKTVARFLTKYSKGESYLGPDVRRSIQAAYHEALNAPHEQARDELFTSRIDMIDRWHSRERPAEMRLVTGEGYALPIKRIRLLRSIEASLQELPFITKVIRGPGLYDRHRLLVKELQQYHEVGA